MTQRKINKVTSSPLHQGFLGQGHLAAAIIDGRNFTETDPFILLMDDHLDLPGGPPVGGPHPHAGFETVTLVLQGDEKEWKTGSLEVMTAGKGIVHTEEITSQTRVRILQLWLVLPPDKRWAEPFLQQLLPEDVPELTTGKSSIRVYSGSSNGLRSPLQNQTPFTLIEARMEKDAEILQELPASYNGFIYVIEGAVSAGESGIVAGQAGWLDKGQTAGATELLIRSTVQGTRFVLYAGEPQLAPIISHGPFIGDNEEDIRRLYKEYRDGKIPHLNSLPESRRVRRSSSPFV